jgi:type IV secretory pathway VirB10-like protein
MKLRLTGGGASVKDGRAPRLVVVGSIAVAAAVGIGGLWVIFGRDEAVAGPSMSAEGEKLVAQGNARAAETRASAEKLQKSQKTVGEGAEFDSDGKHLGAAADETGLRNRTYAQLTQEPASDRDEAAGSIRAGVQHRGYGRGVDEAVDEKGSGGQGRRQGWGGGGGAQPRQPRDRSLATQSMLALAIVKHRSDGDASRSGKPSGKNSAEQRAQQDQQSDDRMARMMEGLGEKMLADTGGRRGAGAEGGQTATSGSLNASLYPAASEAQTQPRGGIGDMTIGSGPSVVVRQGKFLDCVLVNELRVDLAESPVIVMVNRDFLSANGDYVLGPAGAKLLGTAGTVQSLQQTRVYIKFDRIIFPDGRTAYFPVRQVGAVDGAGAIGVPGDVDRHLMLQFGAAIALGVLDGLAAAVQRPASGDPTVRDLVVGRTSSNFSTIVGGVLQRYANVMPTVTVEPGSKMKVFFTEDVRLSAYMASRDLSWMRP